MRISITFEHVEEFLKECFNMSIVSTPTNVSVDFFNGTLPLNLVKVFNSNTRRAGYSVASSYKHVPCAPVFIVVVNSRWIRDCEASGLFFFCDFHCQFELELLGPKWTLCDVLVRKRRRQARSTELCFKKIIF